jgi:hypothetical protein
MLPETSNANTIDIPSDVTLLPLVADLGRAKPIIMHTNATILRNCGNQLNLFLQVTGDFFSDEISGKGIAVAFFLK